MFVLLFGLMGLLAMIPIANFHLLKAAKYDRAAAVAQIAFGEIRARDLLRPERWVLDSGVRLVDNPGHLQNFRLPSTYAFDPLWMTPTSGNLLQVNYPTHFPQALTQPQFAAHASHTLPRVSLPSEFGNGTMGRPLADKLFVWNGDLTIELPDDHDVPSRMLVRRSAAGAPLVRESHGHYSWMFTAMPSGRGPIWDPITRRWGGATDYEVSVVVFYQRLLERSIARERIFRVSEFYGGLGGGEARLVAQATSDEFEGLREGQWLLLTAPEPSGRLVAKWYRVVTAGEGFGDVNTTLPTRWIGLAGPDWDATLTPTAGVELYATFVEDIVGVFTTNMRIPQD
jgi:hypothetical protein